jgi:hypothetical protein
MPQVNAPAAAASVVIMNALAAKPLAAIALSALKPYQPIHRMPVRTAQNTMLCGAIFSLPKPMRGPMIKHSTNADQPEAMCTTVPPAKSMALIAESSDQPFINPLAPQTMWAVGK